MSCDDCDNTECIQKQKIYLRTLFLKECPMCKARLTNRILQQIHIYLRIKCKNCGWVQEIYPNKKFGGFENAEKSPLPFEKPDFS